MRTYILTLLFLLPAVSVSAQTYEQRAQLARNAAFQDRVMVATLVTAAAVLAEPTDTTDFSIRTRFAGYVLRDPEAATQRLARILAAVAPVTVSNGQLDPTLTDTQLQQYIATRWTAIGRAMMTYGANIPQ